MWQVARLSGQPCWAQDHGQRCLGPALRQGSWESGQQVALCHPRAGHTAQHLSHITGWFLWLSEAPETHPGTR